MNIIAELEKVMVKGIGPVIDGKSKHFKTDLPIYPAMIEAHMEKHGYEKGELDTNGWQYDWWLPFTKEGKSFTAFGGGYYGGFEFTPAEV